MEKWGQQPINIFGEFTERRKFIPSKEGRIQANRKWISGEQRIRMWISGKQGIRMWISGHQSIRLLDIRGTGMDDRNNGGAPQKKGEGKRGEG